MNTSRADRRRTLALRAFPPRWRERHGDELLHVSSELASSSDHHASWRELVDIVRGGLSVRVEDRPPFWVRAAYRWFEKPVPSKWHAWMRDDLRGRFLGYRRSLLTMFPMWLVIAFMAVTGGPLGRSQAWANGGIVFAVFIAGGPFQARRIRKRMNAKIGYDIVAADALPPPTLIAPPVQRRPASRMPYVRYAAPLSVWSLISGAALIAGAAISNAPNRSIGPVTFSPDPNSPLTAQQVELIGVGVAIAAIALAVATAFVTGWRVRTCPLTTAHKSDTLSALNTWSGATIIGVPATLLGALGVLPDLACASIGAALVLAGAANGIAAFIVARRDVELGRHISLAELLVGERDLATRSRHRQAGVADR